MPIPNFSTQIPESQLKPLVRKVGSPGLYYAFFDKERLLFEHTYGHTDLASNQLVHPASAFYAYSMTKTFSATAVMQLVEQGKLDLDTPVVHYLPEFQYGHQVLVRHLMAHSSGIPNPLPIRWIHLVEAHAGFDEQAFFSPIFQQNNKVRSSPNERMAYSNLGFLILGQLIEKVSGKPYKQFVEEQIIQPLSLTDQLGFERKSHWQTATGYQKAFSLGNLLLTFMLDKAKYMDKNIEGWVNFRPFYVNGAAYGGLIGVPNAFVRFAQDFLQPKPVLLSRPMAETMFSENHLNHGKASGMALGWFCGLLNGQRFLTHAGGGGGYYCEMRIYPERGQGSLLMTNRSGFSDERQLQAFDRFFIS